MQLRLGIFLAFSKDFGESEAAFFYKPFFIKKTCKRWYVDPRESPLTGPSIHIDVVGINGHRMSVLSSVIILPSNRLSFSVFLYSLFEIFRHVFTNFYDLINIDIYFEKSIFIANDVLCRAF